MATSSATSCPLRPLIHIPQSPSNSAVCWPITPIDSPESSSFPLPLPIPLPVGTVPFGCGDQLSHIDSAGVCDSGSGGGGGQGVRQKQQHQWPRLPDTTNAENNKDEVTSEVEGSSLRTCSSCSPLCSQWCTMSTQCATRFPSSMSSKMMTTKTSRRGAPPKALVGSISTSTQTTSSSTFSNQISSSIISSSSQRVSSSTSSSSSSSSSYSTTPSSSDCDRDHTRPAYLPTPPTTPLQPVPPPTASLSLSFSSLSLSQSSSSTTTTSTIATTSKTVYSILPNEILTQIFHHVPNPTLATLMLVNSHFYALCERLLYHTLHCVQLFASPFPPTISPSYYENGQGQVDEVTTHIDTRMTMTNNRPDPSWRLLHTLSSRPSTALAVRHFAVKGLPWLDEEQVSVIVSAIRAMTNLVSLEINLGVRVEKMIVSGLRRAEMMMMEGKKDKLRRGLGTEEEEEEDVRRGGWWWWSRLTALNVLDVYTALYFLGWDDHEDDEGTKEEEEEEEEEEAEEEATIKGKSEAKTDLTGVIIEQGGRSTKKAAVRARTTSPITVLRLDSQNPLDGRLLRLLTAHLRRSGGDSVQEEKEDEERIINCLQLAVQCTSVEDVADVLAVLARDVGRVETLGLHLSYAGAGATTTTTTTPMMIPGIMGMEMMTTGIMSMEMAMEGRRAAPLDIFSALSRGLSPFTHLQQFSLATSMPFRLSSGMVQSLGPASNTNARANNVNVGSGRQEVVVDIEAFTAGWGPQLRLVELQWDAWRTVSSSTTSSSSSSFPSVSSISTRKWEAITMNKNRHPFLRRRWAYELANVD